MSNLNELINNGMLKYADKKGMGIEKLPLTNADKIRSVSDEELAEFLTRITNDAQLNVGAKCNYQWDEWLQNEVEE